MPPGVPASGASERSAAGSAERTVRGVLMLSFFSLCERSLLLMTAKNRLLCWRRGTNSCQETTSSWNRTMWTKSASAPPAVLRLSEPQCGGRCSRFAGTFRRNFQKSSFCDILWHFLKISHGRAFDGFDVIAQTLTKISDRLGTDAGDFPETDTGKPPGVPISRKFSQTDTGKPPGVPIPGKLSQTDTGKPPGVSASGASERSAAGSAEKPVRDVC